MKIRGHVANGVVVPDEGPELPEGTAVTILAPRVRIQRKPVKKKKVRLPLVNSKQPGKLKLTNDRIAKILEAEDIAALSPFFKPGPT
jgi:hypothetical protein